MLFYNRIKIQKQSILKLCYIFASFLWTLLGWIIYLGSIRIGYFYRFWKQFLLHQNIGKFGEFFSFHAKRVLRKFYVPWLVEWLFSRKFYGLWFVELCILAPIENFRKIPTNLKAYNIYAKIWWHWFICVFQICVLAFVIMNVDPANVVSILPNISKVVEMLPTLRLYLLPLFNILISSPTFVPIRSDSKMANWSNFPEHVDTFSLNGLLVLRNA